MTAILIDKRLLNNVLELGFTHCSSLSQFKGNTVPALVQELKAGIDEIVNCARYLS